MTILTFSQIEDLWVANGGSPGWAPLAAGIAMAESGGNTTAWNNNSGTGDDSVGLWQINYFGNLLGPRTQAYGSPQALSADPNAQAKAAVALSGNGSNWGPWRTDRAWNAWTSAGSPSQPNSTTVQSWLSSAGVNTGGSADPSIQPTSSGGTSAASVGGVNQPDQLDVAVSNLNTQAQTGTILPGIPGGFPQIPSIDKLNPVGSLASMIPWFGEFAGWAFLTLTIFILGSTIFFLGVLVLISILASPAIGPVTGLVGKATPTGRVIGAATTIGGRRSGGSRSRTPSSSGGGGANPGRAVSGAGRTSGRAREAVKPLTQSERNQRQVDALPADYRAEQAARRQEYLASRRSKASA